MAYVVSEIGTTVDEGAHAVGEMSEVGRLVLLGAPLGNPADASARFREALATADVVAAEDTRRLTRLARDLDVTVPGRIVSYFEGNEERRTPELVDVLTAGYTIALVTDGGMPSVSDPGYRLVRAALDAGVPVTAAPGPSAVTTALALSGLPCDRFCFEGFLPRTPGARRSRLRALAAEERTLVLFEAPHRITGALADLAEAFGPDRPAALCRELTKTYEEVVRRPLGELAEWAAAGDVRGEITLVVAGASPQPAARPDDETLRAAVDEREAAGTSRRDAITEVATTYGLRRREVYEIVHR
ncbi:16S rRNA (cytidine1402-2'-O)-methyltransferase [Micromonospora sediminicola]|uniref:Ribosomal RNA small subunit methyltransferase I n=2 Tax=Micromonosporaceae TaxID=28056 RepID=A0A1A9BI94_9ACTN|nr:16S rRNA (cytidine1402-2'-O)-methyltransferase [Micromonospora sediminicola]